MKKIWIVFLSAFVFACNSADKSESDTSAKTDTAATAQTDAGGQLNLPEGITQEDYDKGLNLVANSDCLTCHQISTKSTGPAYMDVAKKYEPTKENIEMLAGKIIKGGSGNWGTVAMLPHEGLPEEDAKAMAKYVLSFRNAK